MLRIIPVTGVMLVVLSGLAIAQDPACPNAEGGVCLGPLAAGTHTTTQFVLPITYTVPDGWDNEEDLPGNFLLLPPGQTLEGVNAGTSNYIGIYRGVYAAAQDCTEAAEPTLGGSAEAIATWLADHPGLEADGPEPASVGGLDGYRVDVRRDPAWTTECPWLPGVPVVPLIIGDGVDSFLHHATSGDLVTRFYLLDVDDGPPLAIEVSYVPGEQSFDEYLAEVEPVLDGLRFASDTPTVAFSVPDLAQANCQMDRTGPFPAGPLTIAARNDLGEPDAAAFDMFRLVDGATPAEFTAHMSMIRERVAAGDPYSDIVAIGYPTFAEVWDQVEVQAGEVGLLEGEALAGTYMIECTTPLYVPGEFIPVAEAGPIVVE